MFFLLNDNKNICSNGLAGCNGLETGHGAVPEIGVYQCFGQVNKYFYNFVKTKLRAHRTHPLF